MRDRPGDDGEAEAPHARRAVDGARADLVEINKEGTPVLLVEQNALMALDVAHRGYVLETGSVALSGSAKELAANEDVKKAYLGIA